MSYLNKILEISNPYLLKIFPKKRLNKFLNEIAYLNNEEDRNKIVKLFSDTYIQFIKEDYQNQYDGINDKLTRFIEKVDDGIKIIWGDCLDVLKGMKSESIHVMVTSPPYFNARDYSQWENLKEYLDCQRKYTI